MPYHWNFLETREISMLFPGGRLPKVTRHMQPPVIAQAVERIVAASGDVAFRDEALPALERYYRWLAAERDPDRDGLISIIAQFESGLDYNPMYDPPVGADRHHPVGIMLRTRWPSLVNKLRYRYDLDRIFRGHRHQEDVLVNAVYGQGLRALARLAGAAGNEELARWGDRQAQTVTEALLERSYDEDAGLFWNLYGPGEVPSRVRSVGSLMPLVLEGLPAEIVERLVENMTDRRHFWTRYPVPSVARSEPAFVPGIHVRGRRLIWRGPLSLNTNWFLVGGLRAHGYTDVADVIAERSRELAERGGFNEFYDPLTGAPVGQPRFGWATLAADM